MTFDPTKYYINYMVDLNNNHVNASKAKLMVMSTKNDALPNLSLSMNNQLTPNIGNSCMKLYFSNEISFFFC